MKIAADLRDKSRIKLKLRTVGRDIDKSDESLHRTNCKTVFEVASVEIRELELMISNCFSRFCQYYRSIKKIN